MDKSVRIRISIPFQDKRLNRDVRTGEVLTVTPSRMLEIMNVEKKENLELFTIVSIEKGEF